MFISYSHEDRPYFDTLKKYVNNDNCPGLNIWDDGKISPGSEWDDEIKTRLYGAQIILLIISQDFLNSRYIDAVELKSALERHDQKKCRVIPIFAKNCSLSNRPQISKIQGLPNGMKFLSDMGEQVWAHYTEIQREINSIAAEMLTDQNIHNSISSNDGKSETANAIEELRNKGKIFLSVPVSEEGRKKRKAFIIQVEGKIKYEKWPYQIIPSVEETEELIKKDEQSVIAACADYIREAVYSIHIISSETDLAGGINKEQYDLSHSINAGKAFHRRIVWLLSIDLKIKLAKEVSMNPLFTGNDFECMFDLIKSLDTEKEKKINALKKSFSPNKKVFMFYDFSKDHNSNLRIDLKKKIEENENIAVLPNVPNGALSADMEQMENCEGACIFYGASDPEWFLVRQSILIAAGKTASKAICIDEPGIEIKIERDVSKNSFITIRGRDDFENGVSTFLDKLKL